MSSPLDRLRDIVAQLRSPEGCPWDREQTHQSLKPHLIEECYELIDAIDAADDKELKEELGDLLLQVVLHSQMASEEKRFDLDDVAAVIADKLVNRHPHVFGETRLPDSEAVLRQWEVIKRVEKQERRSVLDGVPKGLPALARAQKVQTKAARVGFDWNEAEGALAKVREELNEVESAPENDLHEEIGDLLFALVNFARKKEMDAEQLLNEATTKFAARFQAMERLAEKRSVEFVSLPLTEKDLLWEEAKDAEAPGARLRRLQMPVGALGLTMPETPFPSPEELQKKIQEFMKANFGEHVAVSAFTQQASTDEPPEERQEALDPFQFNATPKQIKAHLDRFVIQQDEAKKTLSIAVCDHYNHVNRIYRLEKEDPEAAKRIEYIKGNVLLLGPTGVGKTYLVKHVADLIGVPFVKADATKFSETGYVGGDVEDLVRGLVQKADGNVEIAQYGIIYIDEIDKIASSSNINGRDVSGRGVQTTLLKLMEETEVPLRNPMDLQSQLQSALEFQRRGKAKKEIVNTRHILFICSGAFDRLKDQVERRLRQANIGFGSESVPTDSAGVLSAVTTRDYIDYGLEPEFIGRLPVRVVCHELSADDLFAILKTSEGSVIRQYTRAFEAFGIDARFDDAALREIALQASVEKTGARGLVTVCDRLFRDFKFELPGSGVRTLEIDFDLVSHPEKALKKLLDQAQAEAELNQAEMVRQFASVFSQKHGVQFEIEEAAIARIVERARASGSNVTEFCNNLFKDYPYGLKLLRDRDTNLRFIVPVSAIENPDKFLSERVVDFYRQAKEAESSRQT